VRGERAGPDCRTVPPVDDVAIGDLEEDDLDVLRPAFLSLHEHHRRVSAVPVIEADDEAWAGRRRTYERAIADGSAVVRLARSEGAVVGYGFGIVRAGDDDTFRLAPAYGEVYSLAVLPAWRDRGIGTRIVDALVAAFAERGVDRLAVAAMVGNEDAVRLYERLGFTPAEVVLYRLG
jgi:ribosomal protein S18 acetylase RimI-like enzyme